MEYSNTSTIITIIMITDNVQYHRIKFTHIHQSACTLYGAMVDANHN